MEGGAVTKRTQKDLATCKEYLFPLKFEVILSYLRMILLKMP